MNEDENKIDKINGRNIFIYSPKAYGAEKIDKY